MLSRANRLSCRVKSRAVARSVPVKSEVVWAPPPPTHRSYSVWDHVRPSLWHPMAAAEQSLMELERATTHLLGGPFGFSAPFMPHLPLEGDEFYRDIMETHREQRRAFQEQEQKRDKKELPTKGRGEAESKSEPETEATTEGWRVKPNQSYSSYSYSSSVLLDEKGQRVLSTRRRYEDSSGQLKAIHEREIDGKRLKSEWHRARAEDPGEHKTICTSGSAEEFEEEWKKTAFGQAETKRQLGGVEETEKKAAQCTPGPDYDAAAQAPSKPASSEDMGVTSESHSKTREEAIAQGSKTQEEETTPPQYN